MRALTSIALFALALVLAACGGGGGTSAVLPAAGGNPGSNAPTTAKTTHANISLYVPPANKQNARAKPFYISPNTQGFAVYVEAYPSVAPTNLPSPAPSGIQIFPVTTPSPCAVASGGGYQCTLNVTAPVGTDLFIVAAINGTTLGPGTKPLSAFISGPVAVSLSPSPGASPLSFTLNGVVNSAAVAVPSPDPHNTPNTQVFTALVPTAAPLAITAYDADGNMVMSPAMQPFFVPITIDASPAADGVTLSLINSSQCGSTASGAGASIACVADLDDVEASYDGSTHPDANDHVIDTFSVAATAEPNASPVPSPANIVLASNVVAYPINTGGNYISGGFLVAVGGGQLLYGFNNDGTPEIGTFTTANAAVGTPVTLNGASSIQAIAVAPNGTLWVEDYNGTADVIDCWSSAASALGGSLPATSGIAPLSPNANSMYFQALTVDSANNVWFAGADSVTSADYAGYFAAAGGCPAVAPTPVAQYTLNGDSEDESNFAAPLANGMAFVSIAAKLFEITTTGPSTVTAIAPALASATSPGGVATDGASNVYAAFRSSTETADAEWAASGTSTLSSLLTLLPTSYVEDYAAYPFGLAVFSPTGTTADRLAYVDDTFEALGAADNLHTTPGTLLAALPYASEVFQVAYGPNGALYVLYQGYTTGYTLDIARGVNTTTWSQPLTTVGSNGGCAEGELVSVDERGNSAPFTVVASPSPNVNITPLPGSNHDFFFTSNVGSPATMSLTITDVNGRSQTIPSFTLAQGSDC